MYLSHIFYKGGGVDFSDTIVTANITVLILPTPPPPNMTAGVVYYQIKDNKKYFSSTEGKGLCLQN